MLQQATGDPRLMSRLVELFQPTVLASAITVSFVTATYFVDRSRLWVSPYFFHRITVAYPEVLVSRGLDGVKSFDLALASSDKKILHRSKMGGEQSVRKRAFTPDQVGALIDLQPSGEAGRLLVNGRVNLFYVVGDNEILFVVSVVWAEGRWCVIPWHRGENGRWPAGSRVFYNTRFFEV